MEKLKVLIVDNDFNLASALNKQLNKMGYEVSGVAETCTETIQKISQCRPDLILMDLNTNQTENSGNIESFLEVYIKGNIPVVFLTNHMDKTLIKKTSIINNSTFLRKPVNAKELQSTIELLLKTSGDQENDKLANKELNRLNALKRYEVPDEQANYYFDRITQITAQFFNVETAAIELVGKNNIWFRNSLGEEISYIDRKNMDESAILPPKFYSVVRGTESRDFISDRFSPVTTKNCFYAAAPLITSDGYILGSLVIMDKEPRALNKSAKKILTDLAAIVMDELELRLSSKMAVKFQHELINITSSETEIADYRGDENSEKDPEELAVRKMSNLINDSNKKTEQIIEELFQSSVVDGGSINLKKESVNLADLATEITEANKNIALKKGQVLKLFIESQPFVAGDILRLGEVIENLVDNAIKYSYQESIININVIAGDEKAYIEVKDQGQGLTEEDKVLLFTKFAKLSAKPTGGESSTGIGLSIVKTIVEMHGGKIWAESEGKNLGSSFIVELPKIN